MRHLQTKGFTAHPAPSRFAIDGASTLLLALNLADGLLTILSLSLPCAEEANPLLAWAWRGSALDFIFVKLALVDLGMVLLCLARRSSWAVWGFRAGAAVYGVVTAYQLRFLVGLQNLL